MPKPHIFTLSKIYRQDDPIEGAILSRIREGKQTDIDLEVLNERVGRAAPTSVILSPYTKSVERWNKKCLDDLRTEPYEFHSTKTGTFRKKEGPLPDVLKLKEGCRVLVKSNMKSKIKGEYQIVVNGDSGTFQGIDPHDRLVVLRDSDSERIYIKPKKYELNKPKVVEDEEGEPTFVDNIVGRFKQYPVVLGYAMTIHKAQGSTMNRVHIQLPSGAMFAPGLLYVALSRVRNLKSLTLSRPILHSDIVPPENVGELRAEQYEL
jgi:ATP-dependent exoDNAse (exonuclease V) alpha subunit